MSIYPIARVWDHSRQRGTALLVLLAIADRADELGVAWAGTMWLSSRARVERRQIIRTIHYLEGQQELIVVRARRPNGQTIVNHYIVTAGASDDILEQARQRVAELLEMRGGVIEDTPQGVTDDTGGVSPMTRGSVSPMTGGSVTHNHGEGGAVSPDPYSYPEEKEVDPPLSASDVWQAALDEMGQQMTRQTFEKWFRGTTAAWMNNELVVYCRNAYAVDWLQGRLRALVERAVASAAGAPYPIQFQVHTA